jgi:uncharacterized protein (DUF2141 family)
MKTYSKFAMAIALAATLSSPVWAGGTLKIDSVSKVETASGTNLIVTSTCEKGRGKVKVWVHNTASLAQTKVYTARNGCGKLASKTGQTESVPVNSLPPGDYVVVVRQDGKQSAPSTPISIP